MEQVNITAEAYNKIKEIMADAPELKNSSLRVFVQGGGCSGFSYGFTFDTEIAEDDFTFESNGIKVLIDSMSMQYLVGARIHYKEELMGSSFVIDNPNAQTSCGCGSSFSV